MSVFIKCDMCGSFIKKSDDLKWHRLVIDEWRDYSRDDTIYHICNECKKDLEKMLEDKEK